MIVDLSVVEVRPGQEEAFAAAFLAAWAKFGKIRGLHRWHLSRGVEKPSRFVFYGEWERLEDHEALAKRPEYAGLLAAVGPFLAGAPEIVHYRPAFDSAGTR